LLSNTTVSQQGNSSTTALCQLVPRGAHTLAALLLVLLLVLCRENKFADSVEAYIPIA
jgi:hypothetical protein